MNVLYVLILLMGQNRAEFVTAKFNADYYHNSSIARGQLRPTINEFTCAVLCSKMHESCPSFLDTHSTENCLVLPETQGLVQTSEKSSKAVKIWYKEPILTIPHFLVLQKGISSEESGFFQDYSLNTENSPIISYGNLLLDSRQTCGMYLENERKVIIKSLLSTFLYEWNFDDQGAIKLPVKTEDITERSFAGCASQNGKLVAYGGEPGGDPERSTFYVYKGSEAKVYQIPNSAYYRAFSCVAFHPQNDDKIYNFGGWIGSKAVKTSFSITLNEEMEIEDLRSLDQDQLAHGCIGYLKPDGKPTILIVGGENSATERITQMLEYDITSNTYSTKPPLNVAASRQVPVIKNNYLYLFGGNREDFGVVQRVELSLTKSWERLEDLVKKPRVALTVPYN